MEFIEHLCRGDDAFPLHLYCCGSRTDAPDHRFGPAARDHYWMIYMQDGTGVYEVNHTAYRLQKGDMFIAFPNRRIYYRADLGSVWSIAWVSIGGSALEGYLQNLGIAESQPICHTVGTEVAEIFVKLLGITAVEPGSLGIYFQRQALLHQLFALLSPEDGAVQYKPDTRGYVDEAIFFMLNNYDRTLHIQDITEHINLEASYFSRLFKRRTGVSPMAWLSAYRLDKSVSLLANTSLTIGEIALSVGITDPLYYSRCFSEKFGIPPSAYRKRIQTQT